MGYEERIRQILVANIDFATVFYLAATLLGGFEGFLSAGCFFLSMLVLHVFCSQASYPVMKFLADKLKAG